MPTGSLRARGTRRKNSPPSASRRGQRRQHKRNVPFFSCHVTRRNATVALACLPSSAHQSESARGRQWSERASAGGLWRKQDHRARHQRVLRVATIPMHALDTQKPVQLEQGLPTGRCQCRLQRCRSGASLRRPGEQAARVDAVRGVRSRFGHGRVEARCVVAHRAAGLTDDDRHGARGVQRRRRRAVQFQGTNARIWRPQTDLRFC